MQKSVSSCSSESNLNPQRVMLAKLLRQTKLATGKKQRRVAGVCVDQTSLQHKLKENQP